MAVYDRAMFRGSRPKAAADAVGSMAGVAKQMAGPMVQQGIAGVMQDMTKGVKSAKNYEQAMNAFRGDQKSVGERRKELGGIVGMKDAKKTPESVLTLVQPVMEMREIKERSDVDRGIGQVAEKAMDTPVEGKMAQGIMQPLKLKPGGPVSLRDYYEKNLPIIQDIYGDTGAEARKDALGQFLLSAAAPAGLAVARGEMDIGEALMATLPVLAQTGAQAKAATRKEKLAQRDAALKMAISDQAAAREKASKVLERDPTKDLYIGGKLVEKGTPAVDPGTMSDVVFTGTTAMDIPGFGQVQPNQQLKIGAKEIARLPANVRPLFKSYKEPASFTSQTLYKKTDDGYESTFVTSLAQANTAKSQGFTEDSRPPGEQTGEFKFYQNKETGEQVLLSNKEVAGMSETQRGNLTAVPKQTTRGELRPVAFRTPQVIAGQLRPAGMAFEMYDSEIEKLGAEARAQLIRAPSMDDIKVLYKRGDDGGIVPKMVYDVKGYEAAIGEGFSPLTPENFTFVNMFREKEGGGYETRVARSPEEMNRMIAGDYRVWSEEYRQVGNQLLSVAPTGTRVIVTAEDPVTLFDANGKERVAKNKQEETAARQDGFHFTKPPEKKGLSVSMANALLVDLSDDIANGTYNEQQLRQFQSAVSIVRDTPRVVADEGGEGLVTVGGNVPAHVIEAVRLAKERDPDFNDLGLLPGPEEVAEVPDYEGIIDPTVNYAASIGPRDKFNRGVANVVDFGKQLFVGDSYNPTNPEAFEAVQDLQYLNTITVTRALNAIGGKDTEGLRQRIESLQVDPYNAFLTKSKLASSTSNMLAFLRDSKKTLEGKRDDAGTVTLRTKINGDISELDYLISQYEILNRNLKGQSGGFGTGNVDPLNAPNKKPSLKKG